MLTSVENYVYQGNRLIKIESFTPDKILTGHVEYLYNQDGTVTMELVYDGDGVIDAQYNHTYENGVKSKTTLMYISSNYSEVISYTYDEKGNLVREVRNSEKTEKTTDYTYDNSGNILSKKTTGGEYTVYKYNYKTIKVPVL
jgi:YD repeat-containing protein